MSQTQRYLFAQDDDSHWYMIPVEKKALFEKLLNEVESGDDTKFAENCEKFCEEFDGYRLDGGLSSISFESPIYIKSGEPVR